MPIKRGWPTWLASALTTLGGLCYLGYSAPALRQALPVPMVDLGPQAALLLTLGAIAFAAWAGRIWHSAAIAGFATSAVLLRPATDSAESAQAVAVTQAGNLMVVALLLGCALLAVVLRMQAWRARSHELLLDSQNVAALIVDAEGYIRTSNVNFRSLVTPDGNLPQDTRIDRFMTGEDWESALQSDDHQALYRLTGIFGATRWVHVRINPIPQYGSELRLVTLWDSTVLRKALREETSARARFEALLSDSHDLLIWFDLHGELQALSDNARRMLNAVDDAPSTRSLLDETELDRLHTAIDICMQSGIGQPLANLRLLPQKGSPATLFAAEVLPTGMQDRPIVLRGHDISATTRTELQLRQKSARLGRIFHANPDAIVVFRFADGKIIDANNAFASTFGYQRNDLVGKLEPMLQLWEDPKQRQHAMEQLREDRKRAEVEARLRCRDGSTVVMDLAMRAFEVDGETCVLCVGRDISSRVALEAAREESDEKFQSIFKHSPDGIFILRKSDNQIHDVNPAVVRTFGRSRKALIGKSLLDVGAIANPEEVRKLLNPLRRKRQLDNIEVAFRSHDDELIQALVSARECEIRGEEYLIAVVKDVGELRAAQIKLMRSEERFRNAFDNAQLAMLLVGMDGKIFLSNRFAQDLLSYTQSEMSDMHISRLIPQAEKIKLKEDMTRLMQGGETRYRSERRLLCQNGLEIWTNFQIVLQREPDGGGAYFAIQGVDVTDIKLSQRRMERMAFYDTLTDLANRRLFQERLQHAIEHCQRSGSLSALLYLDLDQFKRVNDTLGHEAGDALLREVALRLTECVRTEDTVGRTGGDEFTVLLFNIDDGRAAGTVAEKILKTLRQPIAISGHNLVVTTSIGVAVLPGDGQDANGVMKNADLAMYRAKERGRNNYQYFSEDMNTKAVAHLRIENELREGLTRGEFILHYQPKYRISDGIMVGVECLVRWNHPTRGLLAPGEFIQVAEETGAIVNLGSWVIEAACEAGKRFAELADHEFTTAVNISPRQFRDPNLINHIRHCLKTTDLSPRLLQIEITETMLMHDAEAASAIVERLHELGLYLAIDDFGTGYSSLSYLKKFPIQTVKVDRSFITDIPDNSDDMAITGAVIAMAHRLNMDVVAEGVETQGQLQFLRNNQCEYAQGYLFSKPVPIEQIDALIIAERSGVRRLHRENQN